MVVQYRSAAELAAEEIRHRIHAGQLEAGAKISINELAADMRLSSTPVREALKALEREGLVAIAPRSGVYVRRISVDEVAEIYAIKESLEPLIARWAMLRGTADQMAAVVGYADELVAYARDGRLDDYVSTVEKRHQALLAAAGSEVLSTIFHGIDGRIRLLRYRNLTQEGQMREFSLRHRAIAQAISDGDVEQAAALTASNVRSAARSLLQLISEDGATSAASASQRQAWSLADELMNPADLDRDVPMASNAGRLEPVTGPLGAGDEPAAAASPIPSAKG
jgi:DNA-binding GntR family transcriptional regulator